jgi:hypothetical protein
MLSSKKYPYELPDVLWLQLAVEPLGLWLQNGTVYSPALAGAAESPVATQVAAVATRALKACRIVRLRSTFSSWIGWGDAAAPVARG